MELYQCHKRVRAAKIAAFEMVPAGCSRITFDNGDTIFVDGAWLTRNPALEVGGYFVEYPDGYTSYSPAAAFEERYSIITDAPDTAAVEPPANDADDEMMDLYRMDCRVGIRYPTPLALVDDVLLHALRAMLAQDARRTAEIEGVITTGNKSVVGVPPVGSVITLMMSVDRSGCDEASNLVLLPGLGGSA